MTLRARTITVACAQPPSTFLTSLLKSIFGDALRSFTEDDFAVLPAGAQTLTSTFWEQPCPPPTAACKGALAVPVLQSCAWEGAGHRRKEQANINGPPEIKVVMVHFLCVLAVQTHCPKSHAVYARSLPNNKLRLNL